MSRFVCIDPATTILPTQTIWRHSRLNRTPKGSALFLGYLWRHFGPVDVDSLQYEGYTYLIQDTQTGVLIEAYQGASGLAFHASPHEPEAITHEALAAFEDYLESAPPADCEVEFETDFGWLRIGIRNGLPFEESEENE
jgi:hypothetical protein